jgi:hypothetical protein
MVLAKVASNNAEVKSIVPNPTREPANTTTTSLGKGGKMFSM